MAEKRFALRIVNRAEKYLCQDANNVTFLAGPDHPDLVLFASWRAADQRLAALERKGMFEIVDLDEEEDVPAVEE